MGVEDQTNGIIVDEGNNPEEVSGGQASELETPQKIKIGDEEFTIDELKAGYMKNKDYTQKTQELAEQRRQLEEEAQALEDYRLMAQWFEDEGNKSKAELIRGIIRGDIDPSNLTKSEEATLGLDEDDPYFQEIKKLRGELDNLKQGLTQTQKQTQEAEIEHQSVVIEQEIEQAKGKYNWLTDKDINHILAIAEAQGGENIVKVADEYVGAIEEHGKKRMSEWLKEKEKAQTIPEEGGGASPASPAKKLSLEDGSAKRAFAETLKQAMRNAVK